MYNEWIDYLRVKETCQRREPLFKYLVWAAITLILLICRDIFIVNAPKLCAITVTTGFVFQSIILIVHVKRTVRIDFTYPTHPRVFNKLVNYNIKIYSLLMEFLNYNIINCSMCVFYTMYHYYKLDTTLIDIICYVLCSLHITISILSICYSGHKYPQFVENAFAKKIATHNNGSKN
jgi:hypothetical protein